MANEVYYAHTEVLITLDTGKDLTDGVNFEIHYQKPSGATGEWTATRNGQKLEYVTSVSDLDETGKWKFQPSLTLGGKVSKGKIAVEEIHPPIKTD